MTKANVGSFKMLKRSALHHDFIKSLKHLAEMYYCHHLIHVTQNNIISDITNELLDNKLNKLKNSSSLPSKFAAKTYWMYRFSFNFSSQNQKKLLLQNPTPLIFFRSKWLLFLKCMEEGKTNVETHNVETILHLS